jgi:hypothetical protein
MISTLKIGYRQNKALKSKKEKKVLPKPQTLNPKTSMAPSVSASFNNIQPAAVGASALQLRGSYSPYGGTDRWHQDLNM